MKTMIARTGRLLMAVGGLLAVVACQDSTGAGPAGPGGGSGSPGGSSLTLDYVGGATYQASGSPTFDGGDVGASTFATAYSDSVGGYVIASFVQGNGSVGDLFIVQLNDRQPGSHACGIGQSCQARVLGDFDASTLQLTGTYWEAKSGAVQVDEAGPDRLKGSFSDLVLGAQDSVSPDRTVQSGTFDLELLSDEAGKAAMECFLASASGSGGC